MGLDMYIYKVKKTHHTLKELHALEEEADPNNEACAEFKPLECPYPDTHPDYYSIFHKVAYWRKFNALHAWFVTHVQLGIDNCGFYEIYEDTLRDALEVLEAAYAHKNAKLLPPTQGFFWGSTEVDDYYWYKVSESISTFSHLIDQTDWSTHRLFYTSSW